MLTRSSESEALFKAMLRFPDKVLGVAFDATGLF
jgi:hypothetical protein